MLVACSVHLKRNSLRLATHLKVPYRWAPFDINCDQSKSFDLNEFDTKLFGYEIKGLCLHI